MEENGRNDIRRLLKTFGVRADQAITAYLEENPDIDVLHLRVTMEDLTDYGDSAPGEPLHLEIDAEIRNQ